VSVSVGRLASRPRASTGDAGGFDGLFGLDVGRDGVLYVPDTAEAGAPVMLFLHGAGGSGRRELRAVVAAADRYGTVLAAPDSRDMTWDLMLGGFGPDVPFIDRVLDAVVDRCDIDVGRLAIGGISDGATYALSLGLTNGDIFTAIVAFSPGGALPGPLTGRPRIYISHGVSDPILPIDRTSRQLVPALRSAGYSVTYSEFDGGHTVCSNSTRHRRRWWHTTTARCSCSRGRAPARRRSWSPASRGSSSRGFLLSASAC
jgi:phospholipase/carboxylesterase